MIAPPTCPGVSAQPAVTTFNPLLRLFYGPSNSKSPPTLPGTFPPFFFPDTDSPQLGQPIHLPPPFPSPRFCINMVQTRAPYLSFSPGVSLFFLCPLLLEGSPSLVKTLPGAPLYPFLLLLGPHFFLPSDSSAFEGRLTSPASCWFSGKPLLLCLHPVQLSPFPVSLSSTPFYTTLSFTHCFFFLTNRTV